MLVARLAFSEISLILRTATGCSRLWLAQSQSWGSIQVRLCIRRTSPITSWLLFRAPLTFLTPLQMFLFTELNQLSENKQGQAEHDISNLSEM